MDLSREKKSAVSALRDHAVRFMQASNADRATEDQARDLAKLASDVARLIYPEVDRHSGARSSRQQARRSSRKPSRSR